MSYNELVKKHFFAPLNLFTHKDDVKDYLSVAVGSETLGDAIILYCRYEPELKIIKQIKYKVYGNPYLIAVLSYLSNELKGKSLSEAPYVIAQEIIERFDLPKTKYYCAYMIEDAINQLFSKWRASYV